MPQSETPAGLWTTFNDNTGKAEALVRIEDRDGEFLGVVVKVLDAAAPNPLCQRCEASLKGRPIVGMTILRGLRRENGGYAGGTILDPDEGRTYSCTAMLRDGGAKLEVRGYAGLPLFGRSQVWIRAD